MDIRGRGARLEWNEMDVVTVQKDKKIFETVMRWDGKAAGEVSGSPFAAGIGAGASGVGRKDRSRRSKARASARRKRRNIDRAQTRRRNFATRRRDTLA